MTGIEREKERDRGRDRDRDRERLVKKVAVKGRQGGMQSAIQLFETLSLPRHHALWDSVHRILVSCHGPQRGALYPFSALPLVYNSDLG